MKAILFFSILFFSINANSAIISTAINFNGQEWAQINDTSGLTLLDVYESCGISGGTCSGTANGIELDGWLWASRDKALQFLSELFQTEINGIDQQNINASNWLNYFTPTSGGAEYLFTDGAVSDAVKMVGGEPTSDGKNSTISVAVDYATAGLNGFMNYGNYFTNELFVPPSYPTGFFLYKGEYVPPTIETPIPASLFLFAPALLGFLGLRRKAKSL